MSKRAIVLGCLIAILLLGIWYYFAALSAPLVVAPPVQSSKISNPFPTPAKSNSTNAPTITPQQMRTAAEAEANRERGIWNMLFFTPIAFYGKVVDEKGTPVQGAEARLHPADDMNGGSKDYQRTTDENGLFSITGVHGVGITADVSKEGYYALPESSGNYGYASGSGMQPPHNNPNNPAIFILRKMGKTEPLIMFQRYVKTPRDGTPSQMNLTTGNSGIYEHHGDIQVEAWTHDRDTPQSASHPYDWRCKITISGGGGLKSRAGSELHTPTIAPEVPKKNKRKDWLLGYEHTTIEGRQAHLHQTQQPNDLPTSCRCPG